MSTAGRSSVGPHFAPVAGAPDPAADAMLRAVVDASADAIFVKDRQGRYLLLNEAAAHIVGRPLAELPGHGDADYFSADEVRPIRECELRVMASGRTETGEHRIAISGSTRTLLSTKAPYRDATGQIVGLIDIVRDTTAHKEQEQALRNQAFVVECVAEGVNCIDADGVIRYTNPAFDAMFGYERGELLGKHVTVLNDLSEEENARLVAEILASMNAAGVWTGEFRNRKKDGTPFTTGATIRDLPLQGQVHWVSVQRDITGHKRAEEALRERDERLRALVGALPDMIFRLGEDGVFLEYHGGAKEKLLLPPEDFLGKHYGDVLPPPVAEQVAAAIDRARHTGELQIFEYELSLPDVGQRFYEARLQMMPCGQTMVVCRNFTERRQTESALQASEARYRDLIEMAPDGIAIVREGRVAYANRAAVRLVRAQSAEQVIGLAVNDYLHPDDLAASVERQSLIGTRGQELPLHEVRMRRLDGTYLTVETCSGPCEFDGRPAVQVIVRDITERKRAEASLQRRLFELTVLNRIGRICSEAHTDDEVLHRATALIAESLFPDNCGFLLLDAARGVLVPHASFVLINPQVAHADIPLETGITGRTARSGQAQRVADVSRAPEYLAIDGGTRSELCVPIKLGGKVVGVVNVESGDLDAFSTADEQLLIAIAELVGNALQRLRAAESLKESEQRFAQFMQHLPGLAWIKDLQGRYVYLNAAAEKAFPAASEQVYGHTDDDIFPPEKAAQCRESDARALAGESGGQVVETIEHENGTKCYSLLRKFPIPGLDDQPALIGAIAIDISERMRTEAALQRRLFELTVLNRTGAICSESQTVDEVLHRATALIAESLFPDNCGFLLLDAARGVLVPHPSFVITNPEVQVTDIPLGTGITGQVARTGQPLRVGDVSQEPAYLAADPHTHSELCIPIKFGSTVAGVLDVESPTPNAFSATDEQLLSTVVDLVGNALQRLRAAQSLKESEQRFAQFMQHLPGLAWIKDLEGHYIYANQAAEKVWRTPRSHLYGQRDEDIFPPRTAAQFRQNDARALASDTGVQVVETPEQADGTLRHELVSKFPIPGPDGKPALVGGIAIDITERLRAEDALRQSEERYRLIAELSNSFSYQATIAADLQISFHWIAGSFTEVTGYRPEELGGHGWFQLIPQEELPAILELARGLQSSGGEISRDRELRIVARWGEVRWIRSVVHSLSPSPPGEPLVYYGAVLDITPRKRAEEELAMRQAELLHASRLSTVGQMVAALSHEVAQPLNAIGNFAAASGMLLDAAPAQQWDALKEYVQAIAYQSERCGAILRRLRDFSRRATTRRSLCDLNELLCDAVELTASELGRQNVHVHFDLTEPLPPVLVDRVQLQQVVVNLLTNARDAVRDLDESRRTITVSSRVEDEALVFEVVDRGPGLTQDVARHLFEPFFTTKGSGMGIGLSICQTIVKDHGGRMEAHSNDAGGATFRVRLPMESRRTP